MRTNNLNIIRIFLAKLGALSMLLLIIGACSKELPDTGSIQDNTPPAAGFTFAQLSASNYLEVTFSNTSISSTEYIWDFGDGTSSTEKEPVHQYAAEGTFTVKLTASDKLRASNTIQKNIVLTEPSAHIPQIFEFSFEDGTLTGATGDGRDSWKNGDLGGTIQITTSPVNSGSQAAKLPDDPSDQRIGYQLLTVSANTVYDISFYYTMLASPAGSLTVSILDGPVTSHAEALSATIGTKTVNDQNNPDVFVKETVTFNSGPNTEIAIYFFNEGTVETRLDDFEINIGTGTVPPNAAFTYSVDTADYLSLDFTNNSLNVSTYAWDFGDGNSSTMENPSHTYAMEGTYSVTLTASNAQNEMSTATTDVIIAQPSSILITNPSFDDEAVRDDNRIAWRNSSLEADADNVFGSSDYVLQTSTTSRTGSYAGKLPTLENSSKPRRWLYQAITVEANKNYKITGWVRNKDAAVGSTVTFEVYDAPFNTASTIGDPSAILNSAVFDAISGHDTNVWTEASITFNSGSSTEVVLFISNDYTLNDSSLESESFFDDFSITEQ